MNKTTAFRAVHHALKYWQIDLMKLSVVAKFLLC